MEAAPCTLAQLVARASARFGSDIAITEAGSHWTWREVDALRRRAAGAFLAAGIDKGDKIAIAAPNSREWITAAMGLQSIGGILVPVNTRYKGAEVADILRRSGARLLLSLDGFLGTDHATLLKGESLPALERMISFRDALPASLAWEDFLAAGDAVSADEVDRRAAAVAPGDFMDLMFTSGTTGKPKGALLTHEQNIRGHTSMSSIWGLRRNDSYLIVPPFFHSFGYKAGWLACAIHGARILPATTFDWTSSCRSSSGNA